MDPVQVHLSFHLTWPDAFGVFSVCLTVLVLFTPKISAWRFQRLRDRQARRRRRGPDGLTESERDVLELTGLLDHLAKKDP